MLWRRGLLASPCLPPMTHGRDEAANAAVAVAGGMMVAGGRRLEGDSFSDNVPNELFDEASGRWFELSHPMGGRAAQRSLRGLVARRGACAAHRSGRNGSSGGRALRVRECV